MSTRWPVGSPWTVRFDSTNSDSLELRKPKGRVHFQFKQEDDRPLASTLMGKVFAGAVRWVGPVLTLRSKFSWNPARAIHASKGGIAEVTGLPPGAYFLLRGSLFGALV